MTVITDIPPEVLLRILAECKAPWQSTAAYAYKHKPVGIVYPWPYPGVCRYWRDLLLSSPAQWSDIKLHEVFMLKDVATDNLVARCQLQLERSQDRPLSISAIIYADPPHPVLPYLFQESYRWKHVQLSRDLARTESLFGALVHCDILESMRFVDGDGHYKNGTARLSIEQNRRITLPRLRHITFHTYNHKDNPVLRAIHAPCLEDLRIDGDEISIPTLHEFLRSSDEITPTRLVKLSLNVEESNLPSFKFLTDPSLVKSCLLLCPQLTDLRLGDDDIDVMQAVLELLTWGPEHQLCPRLSTLGIICIGETTSEFRFALLAMLASRSEVALRSNGERPRDSWPRSFLTDVRIELADGTMESQVFGDEELARIGEMGRLMTRLEVDDFWVNQGGFRGILDSPRY